MVQSVAFARFHICNDTHKVHFFCESVNGRFTVNSCSELNGFLNENIVPERNCLNVAPDAVAALPESKQGLGDKGPELAAQRNSFTPSSLASDGSKRHQRLQDVKRKNTRYLRCTCIFTKLCE